MEETKRKPRKPKQAKVEEPEKKEEVIETPKKKARVIANALNLRVGPSKNEKVLIVLNRDQVVMVDTKFKSNIWSFVTAKLDFGEVSGYVMTKFIK